MKYSGIKTNERLRFVKCPVCGNDEFSYEAEFCRVCGSAIYNYCQDLYDESGYRVSTGCGKPNPGNARYCEHCGNPTLLYKFLINWEDERSQKSPEELRQDDNDVFENFENVVIMDAEDFDNPFDQFIEADDEK